MKDIVAFRDHNLPSNSMNNGMGYKIPLSITEKEFYGHVYDVVNYVKNKGLTVRQAQMLFKVCEDYILDSKLI